MSAKDKGKPRERSRISKIKGALAVICVLTFLWLVFFGNLLESDPSKTTMLVLSVCWVSFSVLVLLRAASLFGFGGQDQLSVEGTAFYE